MTTSNTPQSEFASPRPWRLELGGDSANAQINDANNLWIAEFGNDADAKFASAAVNAFSPDRDAKLRAALNAAYSHLMNLQPTIANVIIAEHRPFIDNKVNPAMQQIETALALLPEDSTDGQ